MACAPFLMMCMLVCGHVPTAAAGGVEEYAFLHILLRNDRSAGPDSRNEMDRLVPNQVLLAGTQLIPMLFNTKSELY